MILVTGAGGKTGMALINALRRKNEKVRGFFHRMNTARHLASTEGIDAFAGDLLVKRDLLAALDGIDSVYHICPNMHPQELEIARNLLEAMKASGCRRIVYHSVLHPQTSAMPHHWNKLRVEEMIFESGLVYTILQPSVYMQNFIKEIDTLRQSGDYLLPYSPAVKFGFVDLADVAEAAANILAGSGHAYATYELSGPELLSVQEILQFAGDLLKGKIHIREIPAAEWAASEAAAKLPGYTRDSLRMMFEYYHRFGLPGNSNVLQLLLGRTPTAFREALARYFAETDLK